MYVRVCARWYNSLSVCPIRSSIRLSDQIDQHTNNPGDCRVVRRCGVNFQYRGVLLIWITVGQGPIVLAVGSDGGCLDIFFSHPPPLFSFSISLKYCPKGPLSPKQPTNKQTINPSVRRPFVYPSIHQSP